eukprot:1639704-Pleurochrysis_carterae.AAC.1
MAIQRLLFLHAELPVNRILCREKVAQMRIRILFSAATGIAEAAPRAKQRYWRETVVHALKL